MAGKQRYTAAELIEAAKATGGNKSAAARQLNCDRQTVQNYCNRYPTVNRAFEQERQAMVDWAESGLREAVITRKEPWAIKFTLSTLGKDRGYTERRDMRIGGLSDNDLDSAIATELARLAAVGKASDVRASEGDADTAEAEP